MASLTHDHRTDNPARMAPATARRKRRLATRPAPTGPRRAVIVTRMSKDDGDNQVNHDTQEAGCRRKAEALGAITVAVCKDDRSGDRLDRPGMQEAIRLIADNQADLLITYATDRLARKQTHQAVIVHEVRRAGGEVVSATEDLADGPLGDFLRGAYAFAAEVELTKIRERTTRGLDAKFAARGRYKPGPKPLFGYVKHGAGAEATYSVHPVEAEIVRRIWAMAAGGQSRTGIAKALEAEGIPSPDGGHWHPANVSKLLSRDVYVTGRHTCWRTRTERDADHVPYAEPRPVTEQYEVGDFPILVDAATAAGARAAATRNRWRSRREDRDPQVGLLRYGFAVCGGCGRRLSVTQHSDGTWQYKCTHPASATFRCPAPAVIAVDKVDEPVWWWVQDTICDPRPAIRYAVVVEPGETDPALVAALAEAERRVGHLTTEVHGLIDNLALLSGAAARLAAERANARNGELEAATVERDRLAADLARQTTPRHRTVQPQDAIARAAQAVIAAMWAADPTPAATHRIEQWARDTTAPQGWRLLLVEVPESWQARQAACAVLNLTVAVHRTDAPQPRWVAEMRLPEGGILTGAGAGDGRYTGQGTGYLTPTPRSG